MDRIKSGSGKFWSAGEVQIFRKDRLSHGFGGIVGNDPCVVPLKQKQVDQTRYGSLSAEFDTQHKFIFQGNNDMAQFDIEALKQKYKKAHFFELSNSSDNEKIPTLAKIDDFFELSHQVGYIENHTDEDDENEHFETMMLSVFLEESVEYAERQAFYNYIYEKHGNKLKKLIHLPSHTTLTLIGLDIAIRYYYDGEKEKDEQELIDRIMPELENIYNEFCKEQELIKSQQEEQEKQLEKNIFECILSHKEDYLQATSQRAKERIVTKVQLELKAKYGIISASNYRANKEFIRSQFEEQVD